MELDFKGILHSSCVEKQQCMGLILIAFDHWERTFAGFVLFKNHFLFMHVYSLILMLIE